LEIGHDEIGDSLVTPTFDLIPELVSEIFALHFISE